MSVSHIQAQENQKRIRGKHVIYSYMLYEEYDPETQKNKVRFPRVGNILAEKEEVIPEMKETEMNPRLLKETTESVLKKGCVHKKSVVGVPGDRPTQCLEDSNEKVRPTPSISGKYCTSEKEELSTYRLVKKVSRNKKEPVVAIINKNAPANGP